MPGGMTRRALRPPSKSRMQRSALRAAADPTRWAARRRMPMKFLVSGLWAVAWTLAAALPVAAADYPAPKEGSWVVRDFRFHTGEVLPELRLHYTTLGAPTGEPILVLHGTTQ